MRVAPRPAIAVGIFIAYAAIVTVMSLVGGVDYDEIGDTTANVRDAIVIPIGVGAVFLAASTTWLGWWRPALFEARRAGSRWMLAVPVLSGRPRDRHRHLRLGIAEDRRAAAARRRRPAGRVLRGSRRPAG